MDNKIFILTLSLLLLCGCTKINENALPVAATGEISSMTQMSEITSAPAETSVTENPETVTTTYVEEEQNIITTEASLSEENSYSEVHIIAEEITLSTYKVTLRIGSTQMPLVTMLPENCTDKSEIWTSSDESIATVDRLGNITGVSEGKCTVTVYSADNPDVFAEVAVEVSAQVQNDNMTYINGILVVNKSYSVPADYAPGIDADAQSAFNKMQSDAAAAGLNIYISSAYRSYEYQSGLYQRYVDRDGKAAADTYSARPGHSEHQTGLAFDLNTIDSSFANTAEGKWVAENCHKYGFIIRYPQGKENITGFIYEPWHIRYLGEENAKSVFDSGLTLEEYLGIDSVYSE